MLKKIFNFKKKQKKSSQPVKKQNNSKNLKNINNNDPFFARPTVEKRERFHPTNFLNNNKDAGEIKVIPLGGMEQVGQNCLFLEWGDDIVIIDTGFLFPSPEHLGIDFLIPDISYLKKNKHKIRGIIYTHGHLDHIGGIPFMIPDLEFPPMYASRLTKELILSHSDEYPKVKDKLKITTINPKSKIKLGRFEFEFFHINHSIPDGLGIVAKTPYGSIVHTGDFKFDFNPSDDQPINLGRIAQIGSNGVVLAMVDSTNAMMTDNPISESRIERSLEKIIQKTKGRLIVATFSSNIGRASKLIEIAEKYGRTVFLSGRSMERNIEIAKKLKYLKCKKDTVTYISKKAETIDPKKVLILSTGSQGEELAALTRMAAGMHKNIKLRKSDTVVFSASTIPGNELAIVSVLNNLADIGVKIIQKKKWDLHVSGHAYSEQCKLMVSLLNPKYFAPIHGEIYQRAAHKDLIVEDLQFNIKNTFLMKNGQGVILSKQGARLMKKEEVVSGADVLIEVGEKAEEKIMVDRQLMADSGIIFVIITHLKGKIKNIDIRYRGFIYMDMRHEIFLFIKKEISRTWENNYRTASSAQVMENQIIKSIEKMIFRKIKKHPLVEIVIKKDS